MLASLVGFNTVSHRSNLDLIDFVYEYLSDLNLQPRLDFNSDRSKANLYAVIGPADRSGIALSGHTDVVPVEGQDWTRDPWDLSESEGRLYGRGTTDMKGFIATVLAAVPEMVEAPLRDPVHLCFSYDEEVGCLGVRSLLEYLAARSNKPRACIVGEPTQMRVIAAHKGKLTMRCRVKGHACHSALTPGGVNAVEAAVRIISRLMELAHHKRDHGPFDEEFEVPYTTVHTGVVHGGTTVNIVPAECRFDFEFRHLPNEDPEPLLHTVREYAHTQVEPEMRRVHANTGFKWEELSRFPGLDTDLNAEIVQLVQRLSGSKTVGKVGFGTEAGGFDAIGIPTVVCGPGSIEQAHKPDEFVTLEQLGRCERFVRALIGKLTQVM